MSANDPLRKHRNIPRRHQNQGFLCVLGEAWKVPTYWPLRCPVLRRHDSYPGFRMELENRVGDGKGKGTSGKPTRPKVPRHRSGAHCFVRAKKRGNARGAKGAGHPRQDGGNGQPEELLVLAEAGRLPRGGTSRMRRESHVRICGGLGVKFPGSTRPLCHGA